MDDARHGIISTQAALTVFGAGACGERAVAFDAEPGVRVLVRPAAEENNASAQAVASNLADSMRALAEARRTGADLRRQLEATQARIAGLEESLEAAIRGRRRFFGPVWLMDPVKQESGLSLPFASLAEVRREHPELWVVGATADGVLLDAWGGP